MTETQSESATSGNHDFTTFHSTAYEHDSHWLAQNAPADQGHCAVMYSNRRIDRNSEVCG
jgi:hypothetical protein